MNINDSDNPDAPNPSPVYKPISAERQAELMKQLEYLKTVKLPEQRTPAWYKMRNEMITASDFGVIMEGKTAFGTAEEVIFTKCGLMKKEFNQASLAILEHGVKHEENATRFYELLRGVTVTEFGCMPHPKYSFVGASPDGISSDAIMLEIKCPPKRKITGEPRIYYWHQMQGQLEVCDLDRCDFLECKIVEYETVDGKPDRQGYYEDVASEVDEEVDYRIKAPKGSVIGYKIPKSETPNKLHYLYSDFNLKEKEHREWELEQIKWISAKWYQYVETTYWEMLHYSNIPVYRDPEWFPVALQKLEDMWNQIVYYREHMDEAKSEYEEYLRLKRLKSRRGGVRSFEKKDKVFVTTTLLPLVDLDIDNMTEDEFKLCCQYYYGHVTFGKDIFSDKHADIMAYDFEYDYDNDHEFKKLVVKKKAETDAEDFMVDDLEAEFYPHLQRSFRGNAKKVSKTGSLFSDSSASGASGASGASKTKTGRPSTIGLFSDNSSDKKQKSKTKTGRPSTFGLFSDNSVEKSKTGGRRVQSRTFGLFSD